MAYIFSILCQNYTIRSERRKAVLRDETHKTQVSTSIPRKDLRLPGIILPWINCANNHVIADT